MHSTPVSMARPKLANSSPIASASPTVVWITPGGRFFRLGRASARFFHLAERLLVQLDLEIDVAQAVVAVDLGRAAVDAQRATLPMATGPCLPGTLRRASRARSWRAPGGSLTTMGTWRCARLSFASPWS
jgi:hypothetical protein